MHQMLCDAHGEARFLLQAQFLLALGLFLLAQISTMVGDLWAGCGIAALANAYFYRRLFSWRGAQQLRPMMRAFYWGQCGKWVLSIALFFLAFKVANLDAFGILLGYSFAQLLNGLTPFYGAIRSERRLGGVR